MVLAFSPSSTILTTPSRDKMKEEISPFRLAGWPGLELHIPRSTTSPGIRAIRNEARVLWDL